MAFCTTFLSKRDSTNNIDLFSIKEWCKKPSSGILFLDLFFLYFFSLELDIGSWQRLFLRIPPVHLSCQSQWYWDVHLCHAFRARTHHQDRGERCKFLTLQIPWVMIKLLKKQRSFCTSFVSSTLTYRISVFWSKNIQRYEFIRWRYAY